VRAGAVVAAVSIVIIRSLTPAPSVFSF